MIKLTVMDKSNLRLSKQRTTYESRIRVNEFAKYIEGVLIYRRKREV